MATSAAFFICATVTKEKMIMSVPAAYLGVVLIWGTTPLFIKWSGEDVGYLFGVTWRMVIGVTLALTVLKLMRLSLPWNPVARRTYLTAGLGIYLAMTSVYWASQYIPSGWIAVVFGMSPIVTGLFARVWLTEVGLTPMRLLAMLVALAGLALVFGTGLERGEQMVLGIAGVCFSVVMHAASAVWIKRLDAGLHGLVVTCGGLLVAVPLFLLSWLLQDGVWPESASERTIFAIVYLGVIGSVLGFALYYYVLRHVETTRVALITLVTPVIALVVGSWLNGESMEARIWFGALLIMSGLAIFEFGSRLQTYLSPSSARERKGQ
jgi:drug/metabolite transporter (DMT)-like permease